MKMIIVNFEGNVAVCKSENGMYYTTVERDILKELDIGDEVDLEQISKETEEKRVFGKDYIVCDDVIVELKH